MSAVRKTKRPFGYAYVRSETQFVGHGFFGREGEPCVYSIDSIHPDNALTFRGYVYKCTSGEEVRQCVRLLKEWLITESVRTIHVTVHRRKRAAKRVAT